LNSVAIFRTAAVAATVAIVLNSAGCRKYAKSLALPAKPQLPYIYSQKDYDSDIAVYNANASFIADDAKQRAAQAARNDIAWGLMGLMDDVYNVYSAHLYSGKGAIAVTGDAANLGLMTAVAIARRSTAQTLFGALGTAVTGISLSVDKNVFAQQTYQVIAVAMETRRTALYTEISDGLAKKTVLEYPLNAVKRDLVLYLYAGSLPGGLQEIQREAGAASAATDAHARPAGAPIR
jgi:hypothetical protein